MKTTTHPTRTPSPADACRMLSKQAVASGLLGRYRAAVLTLGIGFVVSLAGAVALLHADAIASNATSALSLARDAGSAVAAWIGDCKEGPRPSTESALKS